MAVNLMAEGSAWGASNWWEEDDTVASSAARPDGATSTTTTMSGKNNGDLEAGSYNKMHSSEQDTTVTTEKKDPFKDAFKTKDDPAAYMGIYNAINDNIQKINENENEISQLRASYQESTQATEKKQIMERFETIMTTNREITKKVQTQLKEGKAANDTFSKENTGSSVAQWRVNQLNSCTRHFKTSTTQYQKELTQFQNVLKQTQRRQIGVVAPKAMSEQEQDKLAENYEAADQFLKQQFDLTDVNDQMLDRLAELEARHNGMLQIEQGVKELQEMWVELHTLIMDQQEMLDNIENNVNQTRNYVFSGVEHITKAEVHQKQSRKLQLCLLCMILVIAAVLVGVLTPQ